MKFSITIIFLTFSFLSFGQEYKIEYGSKRYMKYHYHCSHDNGFNLKKKLKDGKYLVSSQENPELILIEGNYQNRRKSGKWKIYNPYEKTTEYQTFENGQLLAEKGIDSLGRAFMEIKHTEKMEIGVYYGYHSKEQLRFKDEFWNNKKQKVNISTATYFYPSGKLKSVTRYKNGNGHGKSFKYYENGQKEMEFEWDNNKQIGIWKWWNEKGELTKTKDYKTK